MVDKNDILAAALDNQVDPNEAVEQLFDKGGDAGDDAGGDAGDDAGGDSGDDAGGDSGDDAGDDAGGDNGDDAGDDAGGDAAGVGTDVQGFLSKHNIRDEAHLAAIIEAAEKSVRLGDTLNVYNEKVKKFGDVFANDNVAKVNQFIKATGLSSESYNLIADKDFKRMVNDDPIGVILTDMFVKHPEMRSDADSLRKELELEYGVNQGDNYDGPTRTSSLKMTASGAESRLSEVQSKISEPTPFSFETDEDVKQISERREASKQGWSAVAKSFPEHIKHFELFGSGEDAFKFEVSAEMLNKYLPELVEQRVNKLSELNQETFDVFAKQLEQRVISDNIHVICKNYHALQSHASDASKSKKKGKRDDERPDNSGKSLADRQFAEVMSDG